MTWLAYLDGTAVQIVAKLAPWLAPLPTAWLVFDHTQQHLGWPAVITKCFQDRI